VEKAKVNNVGQFESVLVTGTAPLVVASETLVTNLNADKLDGTHLSGICIKEWGEGDQEIVSNTFSNPYLVIDAAVQGGFTAKSNSTYGGRMVMGSTGQLKLQVWDGVSTWKDVLAVTGGYATPVLRNTAGNELADKVYVDAKLTTWSFGAFYEGEPTTGAKQARFVIPTGAQNYYLRRIKYVLGAAGTGSTLIKLEVFNSAGTLQHTYTTTIDAAKVADVVYENDVTDEQLQPNEYLKWTVTGAGGTHQDISIWAEGDQEVI
jgi:hypothetical protein